MKNLPYLLSIVVLTSAFTACARETSQEATATTGSGAAAEPKSAEAPAAKAADAKPADVAPRPRMIEVPQGTAITVILTDALSSGKNKAGDTFTGSLGAPIVVKGETVVARGATVKGRVIDVEDSGRVKGKASIRLGLTSIVSGGKSYAIVTNPFVAEAEATKGRDAGVIAGGGGVGAAIGALAGGKKGAATGAVIGAAAGTGAVLATKGKEVEFDSEAKLTFALEKPVELPAR